MSIHDASASATRMCQSFCGTSSTDSRRASTLPRNVGKRMAHSSESTNQFHYQQGYGLRQWYTTNDDRRKLNQTVAMLIVIPYANMAFYISIPPTSPSGLSSAMQAHAGHDAPRRDRHIDCAGYHKVVDGSTTRLGRQRRSISKQAGPCRLSRHPA